MRTPTTFHQKGYITDYSEILENCKTFSEGRIQAKPRSGELGFAAEIFGYLLSSGVEDGWNA